MATSDKKAAETPSPQRLQTDRSQLPPMSPARVVQSCPKSGPARPHSNSLQWASSPFCHLDVLSPGSTMSSFGLPSPDRYPFVGDLLGGRDMSPGTPLTMTRPGATEDFPASPMFSPSLFSPYDTAVPRHRTPGETTKLSLEQDFHNSKMEDLPFASLQNSSAAQLFRHFDSTILALRGIKPSLAGDYEPEDCSLEVSSSSSQHSTSTSSASGDQRPEHRTPLTRTNSIPGVQNRSNDPATSFFSPPNVPRVKASPSGMSPAMSENSTPSHCNCKRSKCLKLYCECFAALRYCSTCNCVDCNNRPETEHSRLTAIQITRERNAGAFETKVSMNQGHSTGCNCKKSQCLKKYCECYEGDAFCGDNCKCISCLNYEGSEGLESARSVKMRKSGGNIAAGAGMKDRKSSPTSVASLAMAPTHSNAMVGAKRPQMPPFSSPSTDSGDNSVTDTPLKKRRTFSTKTEPLYMFFGSAKQPTPKLVALKVLEYLDGKSLYSMSLVNQLWSRTAMDDALWETNDD